MASTASEDAAQEAFASLHRHWDGVRDSGALVAYLRRATINQCRTGQRRLIRGRGALARIPRPASAPSSEDAAVAHDEYRRLAAAIRELPTRQREVLVCRYLLERGIIVRAMTQYPAITDCLRISIGTPVENDALLTALNTFCRDSHA